MEIDEWMNSWMKRVFLMTCYCHHHHHHHYTQEEEEDNKNKDNRKNIKERNPVKEKDENEE